MNNPPISRGPWQVLRSSDVYEDPWIRVQRDEVIRPDGQPGSHCIIWQKPGISVLPRDHRGNIYLTEEFHYAIGRDSLEAVSGGSEPDEPPRKTAERELEEELGIVADHWTPLGAVDPFTTIVHSPTTLFLAEDLRFTETAPEGTELIRCVKMPFEEVFAMVMEGAITHAPTCVLVLKTQWLLQQREAASEKGCR
jgi:ADP-ribose pyrophosphatase